jgi:hypothetical protein
MMELDNNLILNNKVKMITPKQKKHMLDSPIKIIL